MGFFRHRKVKPSYDLLSSYAFYLPGIKGMFMIAFMFIIGSIIGAMVILAMKLISPELANGYGDLINYVITFIPVMIYASTKSAGNQGFDDPEVALDRNSFGNMGGFRIALVASVATVAASFIASTLQLALPPIPQWLEAAIQAMLDAPLWKAFLMVSILAPLFEEWMCRGLILRGLLQTKSPAAAICISAAFFAIIHMNPWQAVSAFVLGLLMGYAYYRTGSLKLTVLMHFVNNTFALILSKLDVLENVDDFTQILSPWAYAGVFIASVMIVASAVVIIRGIGRSPFQKEQLPE